MVDIHKTVRKLAYYSTAICIILTAVAQTSCSTPAPAPPAPPPPASAVPAVTKELELKYDNDSPYKNLVMTAGGFLVNFDPPGSPFLIKKIKLFGSRGNTIHNFKLEIWDKDKNVVFKKSYPDTGFPESTLSSSGYYLSTGGKWIELDIPDVSVSGKFYVHILTRIGGISLGGDNSGPNEHSDITELDVNSADGEEVANWTTDDFCRCWRDMAWDQSNTNWMIRTIGTYSDTINR